MKKHKIDENAANNPTTPETTAEEEYDITKPVENPTALDLAEVEAFNDELKLAEYQRRIAAGELTEADKYLRKRFGFPS